MADYLLTVFILYCIQHIKEILAAGNAALWHLVGEELHECCILLHEGPEIDDTQLVIQGHLDHLDISFLEQLLFVLQHQG